MAGHPQINTTINTVDVDVLTTSSMVQAIDAERRSRSSPSRAAHRETFSRITASDNSRVRVGTLAGSRNRGSTGKQQRAQHRCRSWERRAGAKRVRASRVTSLCEPEGRRSLDSPRSLRPHPGGRSARSTPLSVGRRAGDRIVLGPTTSMQTRRKRRYGGSKPRCPRG